MKHEARVFEILPLAKNAGCILKGMIANVFHMAEKREHRNVHALFTIKYKSRYLKGLGHKTLGNFSTDQIVIELTRISE